MSDFAQLSRLTREERDKLGQEGDREFIESVLKDRASLAVSRQQITLTDTPHVRVAVSGEMLAVITGKNSNGENLRAILTSMVNEESKDFTKRIREIDSGDVISVDGHFETCNWKNGEGKLMSAEEFHVGVVRSPASLEYIAPEGVLMPRSAFEIQNQRAIQAQTMGR